MSINKGLNSAVVWLTVFEAACKKGDLPLAEQAERKLQQLGVIVSGRLKDLRLSSEGNGNA